MADEQRQARRRTGLVRTPSGQVHRIIEMPPPDQVRAELDAGASQQTVEALAERLAPDLQDLARRVEVLRGAASTERGGAGEHSGRDAIPDAVHRIATVSMAGGHHGDTLASCVRRIHQALQGK
jgi:hypothetical protein